MKNTAIKARNIKTEGMRFGSSHAFFEGSIVEPFNPIQFMSRFSHKGAFKLHIEFDGGLFPIVQFQ